MAWKKKMGVVGAWCPARESRWRLVEYVYLFVTADYIFSVPLPPPLSRPTAAGVGEGLVGLAEKGIARPLREARGERRAA